MRFAVSILEKSYLPYYMSAPEKYIQDSVNAAILLADELYKERPETNTGLAPDEEPTIEERLAKKPFCFKLSEQGLSVRTYNQLKYSMDCNTLGDVVGWSARDVQSIRNLGKKTYYEICILLEKFNLHLGMYDRKDPHSEWHE